MEGGDAMNPLQLNPRAREVRHEAEGAVPLPCFNHPRGVRPPAIAPVTPVSIFIHSPVGCDFLDFMMLSNAGNNHALARGATLCERLEDEPTSLIHAPARLIVYYDRPIALFQLRAREGATDL